MDGLIVVWLLSGAARAETGLSPVTAPEEPRAAVGGPSWELDCAVYDKDGWLLLIDYLPIGPPSGAQVGWLFYHGSLLTAPESGATMKTPLGQLRYWGTLRVDAPELTGWNFADRSAIRKAAAIRGQVAAETASGQRPSAWRYRYIHHGRLVTLEASPSRVAVRAPNDRLAAFLKSGVAEGLEPDPLGQREEFRQAGWTLLRVRGADERLQESPLRPALAPLADVEAVEVQPVFETNRTVQVPTGEVVVRCRMPMTPEDFRLAVGPQITKSLSDVRTESRYRLLVTLSQRRPGAAFQASRVLASFAFVDSAEPKFLVAPQP